MVFLVCESDGWHIWASFGMRMVCEWYAKTDENSSETKAHSLILNRLSSSSSSCLWGFNTNFIRNSPETPLWPWVVFWYATSGRHLVCENYANGMRMVCENSCLLDLNSSFIRSSPKFSLETSSTSFSVSFVIKPKKKFPKILSRAMDGTSGRHLVCENYANGMRKQIKIQVKPKHIR